MNLLIFKCVTSCINNDVDVDGKMVKMKTNCSKKLLLTQRLTAMVTIMMKAKQQHNSFLLKWVFFLPSYFSLTTSHSLNVAFWLCLTFVLQVVHIETSLSFCFFSLFSLFFFYHSTVSTVWVELILPSKFWFYCWNVRRIEIERRKKMTLN